MNLKQQYYITSVPTLVKSSAVNKREFSQHFESCSAPICFETIYEDGVSDVIWYPSELLCLKNALSAPTKYVQKVQRRINKLVTKGKFKNVDRAFTFSMLSKIKNVTTATKGLNPEKPIILKRFAPKTQSQSSGVAPYQVPASFIATPASSERSFNGLS